MSTKSHSKIWQPLKPKPGFAPSPQANVRRPGRRVTKVVFLALVLTALSFIYVGAYARIDRDEDRRQEFREKITDLERANAHLWLQVNQLQAPDRMHRIALAEGMKLADPSCDIDFVIVPSLPQRQAWELSSGQSTAFMAKHKRRMTAWIGTRASSWAKAVQSRAEANPEQPEQE